MSARRGNAALTEICRQLMDEWQFSQAEIENIALNISGECAAIREARKQAMAIKEEVA